MYDDMNDWVTYINGNYEIKLNKKDGTKIRETINPNATEFIADFPECMDVKITNQCDMECLYCHENSTIDGQHGELLTNEFINTLAPYTEIAIGGGNPLSHPELIEFLRLLKSKKIIANITVNQNHFMQNKNYINLLIRKNLIYGLGVSFVKYDKEFIETAKQYPNLVLHIINGIVDYSDLEKMFGENLKILILGYKSIRRGKEFYSQEVEISKAVIYDNIEKITKGFKVTSFDNLAIKQLELRRIFTKQKWDEFYMGNDGSHTMYIDLVEQKYALSSISMNRHNIKDNIKDMFDIIKKEGK